MLVKSYSAAVQGVDSRTITVEVNAGGTVAAGKLNYFLVGLPDNAVKEGYQRIEAAIKNIGLEFPRLKLVVNLAPADLRKEGSAYDLPIALAILAATRQIDESKLKDYLILGELSLDGSLRPVRGVLPIAIQARKEKYKGIIVPSANALEAAIVQQIDVIGVDHLQDAVAFIQGEKEIAPVRFDTREEFNFQLCKNDRDFCDVRGQENIKRALEIAAAGGHNVILIGPPGAGKTMLAQRLPGILPPLTINEALETTKIHSVAGILPSKGGLVSIRPFRSPHHTVSDVALVGGEVTPLPVRFRWRTMEYFFSTSFRNLNVLYSKF